MSRHSPTGFAFSLVIEIVAVVAIVSFLPRIDLRPVAAAAGSNSSQPSYSQPSHARPQMTEPTVSHVGWATPDRGSAPPPPALETSHYQRRSPPPAAATTRAAEQPQREPPPLIVADPSTPGYVEQRLDRASQQLVNSVGSAVANAAGDLVRYAPPAFSNDAPFGASSRSSLSSSPTQAVDPASPAPPPAFANQRPAPSTPVQPRPWIRY